MFNSLTNTVETYADTSLNKMPRTNEIVQRLNNLKTKYAAAKQDQVFDKIHELDNDELLTFVEDLESTNPEEINNWYKRTIASLKSDEQLNLRPFPDVSHADEDAQDRIRWAQIGLQKISQGKVAVLLLAGGQGTRLGTKNPKGMFQIGLPSDSSLFKLQAQRLVKLQQLANSGNSGNGVIPWYIMTSEATRPVTINYFEQNNYFQLEKENVFFFEQEMIPCLTPEGKIIMESKSKVSRAPNGNGGVYAALIKSGALKDMERRGVEMVYVYGVDNCLIKMADPVFVGYSFDKSIDCAAKIVAKSHPEEPVGVVCLNNNKACVIEYSEIDKDLATKIDPTSGKLFYNTAHVCMNMLSLNFLRNFCTNYLEKLPFHVAKKKIPSVTGDTNGWKLEMFIFDVFPYAERMACFEVLRNEEFSPLKNGMDSKVDNPVTCLTHTSQLHKQWLKKAGAILENEDQICEISPLLSYSGEGLEKFNGKVIKLPCYLE